MSKLSPVQEGSFVRAGTGPVDAIGIVAGFDPGTIILKVMELGCTGQWETLRLDADHADSLKVISTQEFVDLLSKESQVNIEAIDKYGKALEQTKSALERIRPVPEMLIRRQPVKDLDETLSECDQALNLA